MPIVRVSAMSDLGLNYLASNVKYVNSFKILLRNFKLLIAFAFGTLTAFPNSR